MAAKILEQILHYVEIIVVPITIAIISTLLTLWVSQTTWTSQSLHHATTARFNNLIKLNEDMYKKGEFTDVLQVTGAKGDHLSSADKAKAYYILQSLLIYTLYNQNAAPLEERRVDAFNKDTFYYNMINAAGFTCIWMVVKPFIEGTNTHKRVEATLAAIKPQPTCSNSAASSNTTGTTTAAGK